MKNIFFILLTALIYHNYSLSRPHFSLWYVVFDTEKYKNYSDAKNAINQCNFNIFLTNNDQIKSLRREIALCHCDNKTKFQKQLGKN